MSAQPAAPAAPAALPAPRVQALAQAVPAWVGLGCEERARLLRACMGWLEGAAEAWIAAVGDLAPGEQWLGDLWPLQRALGRLAVAMDEAGRPALPEVRRVETACGAGFCLEALPAGLTDRLLFGHLRCSVRLRAQRQPTQGQVYRRKLAGEPVRGGVAVVLASGAQPSEGPLDALYRLFALDEATLLLLPPEREALVPVLRRALAPLVARGALEVAVGGPPEALALAAGGEVRALHRSGGTWPAPLPGSGRLGWTARAPGPHPALVLPGPWREDELAALAEALAVAACWGGGQGVASPRGVVVAAGWEGAAALKSALEAALGRQGRGPRALSPAGSAGEGLPWVELPGGDAAGLLRATAARWPGGGPGCEVWLHPAAERAGGEVLAAALQDLPFAAVGLNAWSGLIYGLGLGWGAGEGRGLAQSSLLIDHSDRVLLRGPPPGATPPVWARDEPLRERLGRALVRAERGSWSALPQLGLLALQG